MISTDMGEATLSFCGDFGSPDHRKLSHTYSHEVYMPCILQLYYHFPILGFAVCMHMLHMVALALALALTWNDGALTEAELMLLLITDIQPTIRWAVL